MSKSQLCSNALAKDEGSFHRYSAGRNCRGHFPHPSNNVTAALRVAAQVDHTVQLISKFPSMGRPKYRGDVRMLPVRHYPQYLVFYVIRGDEVVILNLRHAARRRLWDEET